MEEMVLILILAHNVQMVLLLMKIKVTVLLNEEMERSIPLKVEKMEIPMLVMAATLLER